ncbi:hypothetical protein M5689_000841 [Euphorbia peplus]|nr:hypothetical protein M5689_000841 [Euphorbia peplus]
MFHAHNVATPLAHINTTHPRDTLQGASELCNSPNIQSDADQTISLNPTPLIVEIASQTQSSIVSTPISTMLSKAEIGDPPLVNRQHGMTLRPSTYNSLGKFSALVATHP